MNRENIKDLLSLGLLISYLSVFIIEIVLLVKFFKSKQNKYWLINIILEICFIIISIIIFNYYDNLPGYGLMPGLSYITQALFSFCGCILNIIMLFVTICSRLILKKKWRLF